jgi:hypothetical protein
VLEETVDRVEGVDPVHPPVDRRQVRAPITGDSVPEEVVDGVADGGHVLEGDTVGHHHECVLPGVLTIEDDPVAVGPPDHQSGCGHRDRLLVGPGLDQDQVAGLGSVDGGLDGPVVIGDVPGGAGPLR